MKRSLLSPITVAVVLFTIGFLPVQANAQPRLSVGELREEGVRAYEQLPDIVTPNDVSPFTESVQYFFAYEQRTYRQGNRPDRDLMRAMSWLYSSMDAFVYGKGDQINARHRSTDDLLTKGLEKYDQIAGEDQIVDIPTFISASANLYAYLQVAGNRNNRAVNAFRWLQQKRRQGALVTSGGKGDNPFSWAPTRPKPNLGSESPETDLPFATVVPDLVLVNPALTFTGEETPDVEPSSDEAQEEQLRKRQADMTRRMKRLAEAYEEMRGGDEALVRNYVRLEARVDRLEARLEALETYIRRTRGTDGATEEGLRYRVVLTGVPDNKIAVIRIVRSLTDLELRAAKERVDDTPSTIADHVSRQDAERMASKLREAGARVEIQLSGTNP